MNGVADSVAEAMQLLPNPFYRNSVAWKQQPEVYGFERNTVDDAKEKHARLKLQAFWQLLVTGFEVLKFSIGKRAKKVRAMARARRQALPWQQQARQKERALSLSRVRNCASCFVMCLLWQIGTY